MFRSILSLLVFLFMCAHLHAEPIDDYDSAVGIATLCIFAIMFALVIIVILKKYRKQRIDAQDVQSSFLESRLTPDSFFGMPSEVPKQLDSVDVDPIEEADVYLAYGRDLQAEEILKEGLALEINPSRQIKYYLKLLDIYVKRRDTLSAQDFFSRIKELTSGTGPQYDEAVTLAEKVVRNLINKNFEQHDDASNQPVIPQQPESRLPEQQLDDDPSKSLIGNLEKLTDGWTTDKKVIKVQTLNARGNLVTSTITIETK